jgi:hypothetical protein
MTWNLVIKKIIIILINDIYEVLFISIELHHLELA